MQFFVGDGEMTRQFDVVNTNFPHLQRFAIELASLGLLKRYYHSLLIAPDCLATAGQGGFFPASVVRQLQLRAAPAELDDTEIVCPAKFTEITFQALRRLIPQRYSVGYRIGENLVRRRNRRLSSFAAARLSLADGVLGAYTASHLAFQAASRLQIPAVLDYPIAHHRLLLDIRDQEVAKWPLWEDSWPYPNSHLDIGLLDEECNLADRIIVGSQYCAGTFPQALSTKVRVCRYSASDTFAGPPSEQADVTVGGTPLALFVGQVSLRKGIPYLIEAMRQMEGSPLQCILVGPIVGRGQGLKHLPSNVHLLGPVPRHELGNLYASSSVLLVPSLAEGLPNVILEAQRWRLPVITTRTGGDEIVAHGQNGLHIETASVPSLVGALNVIADPHQRMELRNSTWQTRTPKFVHKTIGEVISSEF